MGIKGIKKARLRARMKLREVAEAIGVEIRTVQKWESQDSFPRGARIQKLCEVLGCSEAELLNGPAQNELKFNIVWEVNEMNMIDVPNNEVFLCFKPHFNVVAGAFPDDADPDDIGRRVANELRAARVAREARDAELRKGE